MSWDNPEIPAWEDDDLYRWVVDGSLCRRCEKMRAAPWSPASLCRSCLREPLISRIIDEYLDPDLTEPEPVDAPAGSEAKIAELARRFARGEELWHPHDNSEVDNEGRPRGFKIHASGYRGIQRHRDKYQAVFWFDGKLQYCGTFDTPEEAEEVSQKEKAKMQR